jgi:hypothetical protein
MKCSAVFALAILTFARAGDARADSLVVDHTSVDLFDRIPENYRHAAQDMRMMFVDRSVGANIDQALKNCLGVPFSSAPAFCKQWQHPTRAFSSRLSDVQWAGTYPSPNWQFFGWPNSGIRPELPCPGTDAPGPEWSKRLDCFIRYVNANPTVFQVYSWQYSYQEAWDVSGEIDSATRGFFARSSLKDVDDFEALAAKHPKLTFVLATANLARGIGSKAGTAFNDQLRAYVKSKGGFLLDVADIESHDPMGRPCYDNRDGVPYVLNGQVRENFPDDGLDLPAICQHYTTEPDGGHLGATSAGAIRLAKAWWVLMAQIAGWQSGAAARPPQAQGQTPATQTTIDIYDLADYRLTPQVFEQFVRASGPVAEITRHDAAFTYAPLFTHDVALTGDAATAAQGLTARLENHSGLSAALKTAGITPREYAKFAIALVGAHLAYGFVKAGVLKRVPEGAPSINVEFVKTHEDEVTAVLGDLGVRD